MFESQILFIICPLTLNLERSSSPESDSDSGSGPVASGSGAVVKCANSIFCLLKDLNPSLNS